MNRRSLLSKALATASGVVLAPVAGIPAVTQPESTKVGTKGIQWINRAPIPFSTRQGVFEFDGELAEATQAAAPMAHRMMVSCLEQLVPNFGPLHQTNYEEQRWLLDPPTGTNKWMLVVTVRRKLP